MGKEITEFRGSLYLIGDSVVGDDDNNQGLLYVATIESEPSLGFLIREVKSYISKEKPQQGCELRFQFRKDQSPKFGPCFLLEGYGRDRMTWCEGRRILIHRGNRFTNSSNCWIVGKPTANFRDATNIASEQRVTNSIETLTAMLAKFPEKFSVLLRYEG